jgi:hypothetical protein
MLKDEKKINKKIQSKKNNKKTRIKPDMHKKKKLKNDEIVNKINLENHLK